MELGQLLKVQVSVECHATIIFEGAVTREAIDKLIANLELARDCYPDSDGIDKNDEDEYEED
jgi:hypothetical protein